MVRWCYALTITLGIAFEVMAQDAQEFWTRPSIRACCSQADAVFSDDWHISGDEAVVVVSSVGASSAWARDQIGKTYRVPKDKFRWEPNPTGRAILFLRPFERKPDGTYYIYCFVPGSLS